MIWDMALIRCYMSGKSVGHTYTHAYTHKNWRLIEGGHCARRASTLSLLVKTVWYACSAFASQRFNFIANIRTVSRGHQMSSTSVRSKSHRESLTPTRCDLLGKTHKHTSEDLLPSTTHTHTHCNCSHKVSAVVQAGATTKPEQQQPSQPTIAKNLQNK